jgi:hypothetical protein
MGFIAMVDIDSLLKSVEVSALGVRMCGIRSFCFL